MSGEKRHPGTEHALRMFEFAELDDVTRQRMQAIRDRFAELAHEMAGVCPDGPELSAGLRKLLEAKDCFVRAIL